MARQALSLLAGEQIDGYITGKLRLLRQQHTIGRIIAKARRCARGWAGLPAVQVWGGTVRSQHGLLPAVGRRDGADQLALAPPMLQIQASLWPGGLWFQRTPLTQAAAAAAARAAASGDDGGARPAGMEAEHFLTPT